MPSVPAFSRVTWATCGVPSAAIASRSSSRDWMESMSCWCSVPHSTIVLTPVKLLKMARDPLAERGFGASPEAAWLYERGRPGYAPELAPFVVDRFGLD